MAFAGGEDTTTSFFTRRRSIPHLFPDRLVDISVQKVLELLLKSGEVIEQVKDHHFSSDTSNESPPGLPTEYYYSQKLRKFTGSSLQRNKTNSKKRIESFRGERRYLTKVLVSDVMDVLAEASRMVMSNKGFQFLFMVLCNERTHRFVIHSADEEVSERMGDFWNTDMGSELAAKGLTRLVNVQSLVLQKVCTDSIIFTIAEHCHKLVYLDVSYSERVTGIGLVGLCGFNNSTGCKYLRDLIFKHGDNCESIVPKVIACLLRYLENLEVLDIRNLHEGIEYYYKGQGNGHYHPKPERIRPLNLIYYTGSEELLDVIDICPKLGTLKLEASDSLPSVGRVLNQRNTTLEHITLKWDFNKAYLIGLKGFLEACGSRIRNLELVCPSAKFRSQDFIDIGQSCRLLEHLNISHLNMDPEEEFSFSPRDQNATSTLFPFLSSLKLQKIDKEPDVLKNILKYILIHSPELEKLLFAFDSNAYFFSDFFLDEILYLNPLDVIKEFVVINCSLTLISALKLVSSRPKLTLMGNVLSWDVEPSELDTFAQILRKAKALNLLQDISIM